MRRTTLIPTICALVLSAAAPTFAADSTRAPATGQRVSLKDKVGGVINKAWAPVENFWANRSWFFRRTLLASVGGAVTAMAFTSSAHGLQPEVSAPLALMGIQTAAGAFAKEGKKLSGVERMKTFFHALMGPLALHVFLSDGTNLPLIGQFFRPDVGHDGWAWGKGIASAAVGLHNMAEYATQLYSPKTLAENKRIAAFPYYYVKGTPLEKPLGRPEGWQPADKEEAEKIYDYYEVRRLFPQFYPAETAK